MANRKKTPSSDLLSQWLAQNPNAHLLDNPRITTTGGTRDGGYSDIHTPSAGTSGKPTNDINSLANSANYGKLIALLAQVLGTDESSLLGMLGINMQDMNGDQQADWNKQLLDQLMSLSLEYDKRGYNEKMLADQRLYDNPQNQLARLMGAGISRDAAVQMLSGGSGSGGSGVITGDAAAMSQGIPATQSDLNGVQARTAIANSVFGAIGAIASGIGALGSFGISAASLSTNLAATKAVTVGQLLHNTQFQKTLQGIETASTVIGAISSAVDAGVISPDHEFSSSQDMIKTIRDNADKFEPFNALVSSGSLDSIAKDVYSLNALNSGYKSWRESRDYGIDRKHIVRMQALEEMFNSISIEKVNSEIALNGQKIQESIASVINSTNLTNSQIDLNSAQKIREYASASNLDASSDLLHQQYDFQQLDLDWLNANILDINSIRTNQLMLDAACWEEASTPEEKSAYVKSWLKDRANQRTAIALESYYYSNKLAAQQFLAGESPSPITGGDGSTAFEQTAKLAVWWHNLTQTTLNDVGSASNDARLGALRGSAVAGYLIKAVTKLP